MKTFPAIYIDSEGEAKYNLFPEEPEYGKWVHDDKDNLKKSLAYEQVLAAAKQSAIPLVAGSLCKIGGVDSKHNSIHPLPEGWRVEVKESCSCDSCPSDAKCEYCQQPVKVAVLIPPSEIKIDRLGNTDRPVIEDESQEDDLIAEIDDIVGGTYFHVSIYPESIVLTEKRAGNNSVVTEFTIQRRP